MILRITLFFLLSSFLFPFYLLGQVTATDNHRDCLDAYNLVDGATALEDVPDLVVEPLSGPGLDDGIALIQCLGPVDGLDTFSYSTPEDKSFWFSFHASTAGTFEMIITPDNLEGDFDFMIWEGSCPSDPCAVPVFCGWLGPIDPANVVPTGLSSDALLVNNNIEIWEPIDLKANTNYYVLVDHRRPLIGDFNDIGCTIDFDGTAQITRTQLNPELLLNLPDTSQVLPVCKGTQIEFRVDLINYTGTEPLNFDWTFPPDATIQESGEDVQIRFEDLSGEVCVAVGCPVQNQICWTVEVGQAPNLNPTNFTPGPCQMIVVDDYVEDVNNVPGRLAVFASQLDALQQANELTAETINMGGTFWVTKITPTFCTSSPEEITITPLIPELAADAQQGVCELPFDLNNLSIQETNGFQDRGDLDLLYYTSLQDAIDDTNPITETNSLGQIWVRGETTDGCFDTLAVTLVDATPTFQEPSLAPQCNEFDLAVINLVTDNGLIDDQPQFFESQAAAEAGTDPLPSTLITTTGQFWARGEIEAGCFGVVPVNVVVNRVEVIAPTDPVPFCGDDFDFAGLNVSGAGNYEYYTSEADAENQSNQLLSIGNSATVWVRGENTVSGCADIVPIELVSADPTINPIGMIDGCGSPFDLTSDQVPLSEANNLALNYSYHRTLEDAESGGNAFNGRIEENGTYYIRGVTGGPLACFDVAEVTVNLIIPKIRPISPQRLDNGNFDLSNVRVLEANTLDPLQNLSFFLDSLEAIAGTAPLPSSVVTEIGTYWIRGELSGCPVVVRQEIWAESMATLPLPTLINFELSCTGDCLNLMEAIENDPLGQANPNLIFQFFETEEAADDGLAEDALMDIEICMPRTIWVRGTDANGEYGLVALEVGDMEVISGTLLEQDQTICEEGGDPVMLEFQLMGTAPFQVSYTDGDRSFTETATNNEFSLSFFPAATTTYTLEQVVDAKGCTGLVDGSTTVTLIEKIAIENFVKTCDDLQTEYTIAFDIVTGDLGSIEIEGITGNFNGNQFVSDPIPVNENFEFSISDANGCTPFQDNGNHICVCTTEAPVMDRETINACSNDEVRVIETAIGILDDSDEKFYVLHDSNTDQLGEIFFVQNNPEFTFSAPLETGETYYVSAVITKVDAQGEPILESNLNPCIGVSRGTPIRFFDQPEVLLSFDRDTACAGEMVDIQFEMNAEGPFNVEIFGNDLLELTNIQNGHIETIEVTETTDFIVEFIAFSDFDGCFTQAIDNSNSALLEVIAPIGFEDLEINCDSDGTEFTVSFTITGGDENSYQVDGSSDEIIGSVFTSQPILNKSNFRFDVSDGNNCNPIIVQDFGECLCTSDITANISKLQDISCSDASDGAVTVVPENGLPPYSFRWQDGSSSEQLFNLSEGIVFVSMTDANACEVIDSFLLEAPAPIEPEIILNTPSCFGDENGSIIIRQVNGGTRPFDFFFNSGTPTNTQLYGNLFGGTYPLRIVDSNGCEYEETLNLEDPDPLSVSLQNNPKRINLGDSIVIDARISEANISIVWESNTLLSCMDCLNPLTRPSATGIYTLTITNEAGCTASDELVVQVLNDKSFFAPNVFSPNGDGINDNFGVFGGVQVATINSLKIFNRWGAMLYNQSNFGRSIPVAEGWDGTETNGRNAPPGIYVYVIEITFLDGSVEFFTGDVALMR